MTKNIRILIVEDEQIIAESLRLVLNDYGYNSIDIAIDAEDAIALFEKQNYPLVLMDINLGENSKMDGIDVINHLSKNSTFSYIYITANADEKTVKKAKITSPSGYIVKPFVNTTIFANVEMALSNMLNEMYYTHITHNSIKQQIKLSDITHIASDGAYINIYTIENIKYLERKTLTNFHKIFPDLFIQIHKSILVNKNHIQGYTSKNVQVNHKKLSLGRSYKETFIKDVKN